MASWSTGTSAKPSQVRGIPRPTTYEPELQGGHLEGAHKGHQRLLLLLIVAHCPWTSPGPVVTRNPRVVGITPWSICGLGQTPGQLDHGSGIIVRRICH